MSVLRIKVKVKGRTPLARLSRDLRAAADGGLASAVDDELRASAPAAVQDVRSEVLAARFPAIASERITVHGTGERQGLFRARLASGVETVPLTRPDAHGVRITINGDTIGEWGHRLAQLSDGEQSGRRGGSGRWRSPTFGRKDNPQDWHGQTPHPWFFAPVRARRSHFEAGIERAIGRVARDIDGSR